MSACHIPLSRALTARVALTEAAGVQALSLGVSWVSSLVTWVGYLG